MAGLVSALVNSKRKFNEFQRRMGIWLTENYNRLIDLFRKFDTDDSGTLSYDEFYLGMLDLGAPATLVEIYIMAMSLDTDNDGTIDYTEFRKLKRQYKTCSASPKVQQQTDVEENMVQLRPCPNCKIGIWEPVNNEVPRYISLHLKCLGLQQKDAFIGQFTVDVGPEISIYGITRIINRELGGSATNIQILRKQGKRDTETLDLAKKLRDYGYEGGKVSDEPETVELFYDYVYPRLDCPLLLANFYI